MLANLVCSLITERRVTTTVAKAKAARSVAEKMVTLGKRGSLHDRRLASARLHQEDACRVLFKEIAPFFKDRRGGYTRIIRLHQRIGDAAQLAILEWIDMPAPESSQPVKPEAAESEPAEPAPAEAAPMAETEDKTEEPTEAKPEADAKSEEKPPSS